MCIKQNVMCLAIYSNPSSQHTHADQQAIKRQAASASPPPPTSDERVSGE